VALDKLTGKELWRSSTAAEQGYSPPTIINAGGKRQLILAKPDGISSVDPANGKEYWSVPYEATSGSIIMSPLHLGNYLYVAGYSRKSVLLELDPQQPQVKEVWRDRGRDAISPVNVQPIIDGDLIFGCDESGDLCCLEIPSGKRLWATPQPVSARRVGSGTAFIVKQGDKYWLFTENGELVIARMDRDGYHEIDRAKLLEATNNAFGRPVVWSMPAFANRHIYVRNDSEIICVDLGAK
jgi:outer membrane protein assembly factor BamB